MSTWLRFDVGVVFGEASAPEGQVSNVSCHTEYHKWLRQVLTSTFSALVPIRILMQRTVGLGCTSALCTVMAFNVLGYYLPFYFQASRGVSSRTSGLYLLALSVPEALAGLMSGVGVTTTKQYIPFLATSAAVLATGSGLLSTLQANSSIANMLGFEVIASIGFGFGVQVPLTAIRNVLEDNDIPKGNALFVLFQSLGTVLALPIAQVIFLGTLTSRLESRLTQSEATQVIGLGASNVNSAHMDPSLVPFVADSYGDAVNKAIYLAVGAGSLSFIAACMMEWKKLGAGSKAADQAELRGEDVDVSRQPEAT